MSNYDDYKLDNPYRCEKENGCTWITKCDICNDPIEGTIHIVEFQQKEIHCCDFCKEQILTSQIN